MSAPSSSRGFPWERNRYDSDHSEESLILTDSISNAFDNGIDRSVEDRTATTVTTPENMADMSYGPDQSIFDDGDYFPHPAFYRVLCMGSVSQPAKTEVVRKIGKGLIQVLKNDNSGLMPMSRFKEVKHHLVVLSLIGGRPNDIDNMDSFEDNGASLIEADFTWDSNAFDIYTNPHLEALHYAWHQTPASQKFKLGWIEAEVENHDFNGFSFPDKTPDGIDLCIYFYGGDDGDERSKKDMELLWKLSKLGILVLPITSVPNLSKKHIADRLSQRWIKCLDLTGIEMEKPSFRNNHRSRRGENLDQTTLQVKPYEILDIDQFYRIQNRAIYELLKKSRLRMTTRVALRKKLEENWPRGIMSLSYERVFKRDSYKDYFGVVVIALICILLLYAMNRNQPPSNWIASVKVDPDRQFLLHLKEGHNHKCNWPDHDPQVWINGKELAKTERVDNQPGIYQLVFQTNYNPVFFTINSTLKTDIYRMESNETFIWVEKPVLPEVVPDENKYSPPQDSSWKNGVDYLFSILNHPKLFFKAFVSGDDD